VTRDRSPPSAWTSRFGWPGASLRQNAAKEIFEHGLGGLGYLSSSIAHSTLHHPGLGDGRRSICRYVSIYYGAMNPLHPESVPLRAAELEADFGISSEVRVDCVPTVSPHWLES
jgi:hypothetical protein